MAALNSFSLPRLKSTSIKQAKISPCFKSNFSCLAVFNKSRKTPSGSVLFPLATLILYSL